MALAAITFTPLHHGERFRPPGYPTASERIARLPMFCDAYGVDRLALLDAIEELQRVGPEELVEYGGPGISPYQGFFAGSEFRYQTWDYEWLLENRAELERVLRSSKASPAAEAAIGLPVRGAGSTHEPFRPRR